MATSPQIASATAILAKDWGVTDERVRAKVEELVEAYDPLRVVAFGSWARGENRADSDLDLAVIIDDASRPMPARPPAAPSGMAVDVLVERKERHQRLAFAVASVHHDIATEGIVLYDREQGRTGAPFYESPDQEGLLAVKAEAVADLMRMAKSDEKTLNFDGLDKEISAFHGQQAIEKLMKAWLAAVNVAPPRIHDLVELSEVLRRNGLAIPTLPIDMRVVTEYATVWRYAPPADASTLDLAPLRKAVRLLRAHVVSQLATAGFPASS